MIDLTAHRTAGLQDALAQDAILSLTVVVHAMTLQAFYPGHAVSSPLQLRLGFMGLERLVPGIDDSPAIQRINARGSAWIKRLPSRADDL